MLVNAKGTKQVSMLGGSNTKKKLAKIRTRQWMKFRVKVTVLKGTVLKFRNHPILGVSEITTNLYCNCVHMYWEGCVICSIYLRSLMKRSVGSNTCSIYNIYPWRRCRDTAKLSNSGRHTVRWKLQQTFTVCPGSSDPFYIVTYYMKWVTTSWTHSIINA